MRSRWPALPRQVAICITGCLLVGSSLGLTLARDKPVHSAGSYLYTLGPPAGENIPTFSEWLGGPEVAHAAPAETQAQGTAVATSTEPEIVEYEVKEGDTVWGIASAHGTDEESILALNDIRPTAIQIGTKLKVPTFSGAVYKVAPGDTVSEIAAAFGMSMDDVLKYNKIADVAALQVGQTLMLPGAKLQPSLRNQVASRGVSRARWTWPIWGGQVTSEYGPRWGGQHSGLDIGAPTGTPVGAARPGTVIHAGWEGSYGLSVVIDHGDGIQTRYAHASAVTVKAGDWVNAGDIIMRVGSTGYSTGPHLHFEVIVNGVQKNPRTYLP